MDPEAISWPAGSNFAEKISPECPVSSITGAWSPLVLGAYSTVSAMSWLLDGRQNRTSLEFTACTKAPLLDEALARAVALLDPRFGRFTSCEFGSEFEARLFSDIVGSLCYPSPKIRPRLRFPSKQWRFVETVVFGA